MDILDAQVHLGPESFEQTLAAMDALGINAILIDEFWTSSLAKGLTDTFPGYRLANGAWRAASPIAELASMLHPDRFSYFVRLDRRDLELESVMRALASTPHVRAFRFIVTNRDDVDAFTRGGYEPALAIAQDLAMPVSIYSPGSVEYLPRYLKKFPALSVLIGHCGMGVPGFPPGRSEGEERYAVSTDYFDEVLKLAAYPNVALTLGHAPWQWRPPGAPFAFASGQYPYEPTRPYMRRAIQAFGADRLVWATDKSVARGHTWSQLLDYLRYDPELSQEEKEWILGRSARRIFNWPARAPAAPS
jgi:L-fuconolactonase